MLKKNLKAIIATSLVTLSPIVIGLILWDKLPEEIATHFGISGEPDGYSSKVFAVFVLPLIMLVLHLICILATKLDPKMENLTHKNLKLVVWIIPALSLILMGLLYGYALNNSIRIGFAIILFMGVLFIVTGNYIPKVKQNYSIGIKIPWTLAYENNWYRTHRFAGKLWVIGGVIICLTAVIENFIVFMAVILVMAFAPMVYSYVIKDSKSSK